MSGKNDKLGDLEYFFISFHRSRLIFTSYIPREGDMYGKMFSEVNSFSMIMGKHLSDVQKLAHSFNMGLCVREFLTGTTSNSLNF